MSKADDYHDDRLTFEFVVNEDYSTRAIVTGTTKDVKKVAVEVIRVTMHESERARYRRQFFAAAHRVVFGVAFLSVLGMAAHFLNIWQFNTRLLFTMGAWTVGSVIYLYFVIVRDAFGVKAKIPKPPKLS